MLDLAVVILTYNEERHIGCALASIRTIAKEIYIIDSYSTDRTVEIAEAAGAVVLKNKFVNYAKQFEWGLENAPITAAWVMRLDADEVIEPDLVAKIIAKLPTLGADVAGVNLERKHIFMGRWVRHGGRTITVKGGFSDHNLNDLTFFTDKHNKYATREAIDILNQKYGLFARDEGLSTELASFQTALKRFVKERIYNHLPFWAGPLGYFVYRYVFQLGFLDGRSGLVYHFLQGLWYRFLVNAKVLEYEMELTSCASNDERITALERMTGHRLRSAEA